MKTLMQQIEDNVLSKDQIVEELGKFSIVVAKMFWPDQKLEDFGNHYRVSILIAGVKSNELYKDEILAELRYFEEELANWFGGYYYDASVQKILCQGYVLNSAAYENDKDDLVVQENEEYPRYKPGRSKLRRYQQDAINRIMKMEAVVVYDKSIT